MDITMTVTIGVERSQGKFASRDDIVAQVQEAIEGADPGTIYVDESQYETNTWDVEEVPAKKPAKQPRLEVRMGRYRFVAGESRLAVFSLDTRAWVDSPKFVRPLPRCVHELREAAREWLDAGGPTAEDDRAPVAPVTS